MRFRDDPGPKSDAMDISYIETDEAELPVIETDFPSDVKRRLEAVIDH